MFKKFIDVIKPGIIFGNIITVAGGFLLGARGNIDYQLFIFTLFAIGLIIASGCAFNNYIDRDIDKLMRRTQNRVLVTGLISPVVAITYASLLGLVGVVILAWWSNLLTVSIAIGGWFFYVVIYSLWFKRNSVHGTLIGSISGAVPPVVGYCATTNRFDLGAILLFAVLSIWQMPHSYAIAIFRFEDYKIAQIPVLPVKYGILSAKKQILIYIGLFIIINSLLTIYHFTGWVYFWTSLALGGIWFYQACLGFNAQTNEIKWSKRVFFMSIILITALAALMASDYL